MCRMDERMDGRMVCNSHGWSLSLFPVSSCESYNSYIETVERLTFSHITTCTSVYQNSKLPLFHIF